MPQFSPEEVKTAIAPIKAGPAGMSCEAELFLGPDDLTKIATSGRVPFVSAGETQSVNVKLPVTMPSEERSYYVYLDIFADGMRFLAYQATEDVVIQAIEQWLTSEITINRRQADGSVIIPTWSAFMRADMDVTNQSSSPASISLIPFKRIKSKSTGGAWSRWIDVPTDRTFDTAREQEAYDAQMLLEATLQPGETKTFMCVFYGGIRAETGVPEGQFKFVGPFGEVLSVVYALVETA